MVLFADAVHFQKGVTPSDESSVQLNLSTNIGILSDDFSQWRAHLLNVPVIAFVSKFREFDLDPSDTIPLLFGIL